jgi:hypothetical protein
MLKLLRFFGTSLISHFSAQIISALESHPNISAPAGAIASAVKEATSSGIPAQVAASIVSTSTSLVKTWTDAELGAAAVNYSAGIVAQDAFKAGAAWALSHQRDALVVGNASGNGDALGTLAGDALHVAEAAAPGGEGAAIATAVGEAVDALAAHAQAQASPEKATGSAPAGPNPGTSPAANKA